MSDPLDAISAAMSRDMAAQQNGQKRGEVSTFTCPECGGAMWQVDERGLVRFSCHVGHAYYGETLLAQQSEALEAALWTAVRTFKEQVVLARQLAEQQRALGNEQSAQRFAEKADQSEKYGAAIQEYVLGLAGSPEQTGAWPPPQGAGAKGRAG